MRVGVTGHRDYHQPTLVAHRIADVVGDLLSRRPHPIELWTSLAEGADRAAAHAVLDTGGSLVAVLPLSADDYGTDFTSDASRAEFERLLAAATRVIVTGGDATGTREAAYRRAGITMLDAVDVLIAVWDEQPARGTGGTAEIVELAHARGLEVIVLPVTRDDAPA